MVEVTGAWTESQLATFLAESRIPIRIAVQRGNGSLWLVTLWYRYRDGAFDCATWANADVVRFLRNDDRVGFEISTNDPPYMGVRGNGTASMARDEEKATLRALVERYLGDTDSSLAQWLLNDERDEVRIRIHPKELYTWDYTDRMRDAGTTTT